jgi:hypothetical protein
MSNVPAPIATPSWRATARSWRHSSARLVATGAMMMLPALAMAEGGGHGQGAPSYLWVGIFGAIAIFCGLAFFIVLGLVGA